MVKKDGTARGDKPRKVANQTGVGDNLDRVEAQKALRASGKYPPRNEAQAGYIKKIQKASDDVIFGIGPAGTGKTFLAVMLAISALKEKKVEKIIITRPAVEAGENLGFLPGDLQSKVDPYLRPIYDAFYEFIGKQATEYFISAGTIEIAPLAYMRGRTLEKAFVILDEAQNTTIMQMKMFLTRLGNDSKMVVNGDITQVDLPKGVKSGLKFAREALINEKHGVSFANFGNGDIVRHKTVSKILEAFDNYEKAEESRKY
jgi:phosphate starvation-inducible PhoH-like protein